jgi:hypothetical protein
MLTDTPRRSAWRISKRKAGTKLKDIKIIMYGVGAMGSQMVRLLRTKPNVRVVGAIDWDKNKIGRDLGELTGLGVNLGVEVSYPPQKILGRIKADLVLQATTAFLDEAYDQILRVLAQRMNVVTICQELFFPLAKNMARAARLDRKAKEMGVRLTAVGINPGFIMDIVPILCSAPCWQVDSLFMRRVVDFSPYGPDEMRHIGANLTSREFLRGAANGTIGHIGLLETAAMVAHCLGLGIDGLRQTKEPLIARKERRTPYIKISSGRVCGFKQNVVGLRNKERILDLQMVGIVSPDPREDGVEMGDCARINGTPCVDIEIRKEIAQKGGIGTAGVAVNIIPKLLSAPPGFHTMNTLSLPHFWGREGVSRPIKTIINS